VIECINCHTANSDDAQRCIKCGRSLGENHVASSNTPNRAGSDFIAAPPPPPPPAEEPEDEPAEERGRSPKRLVAGTELQHKRYKIEKAVAKGGMGAVYRAFDQHFKKPCAVKEMLDNFSNEEEREQSLQWFNREANMLLELHHPAIPKVFDFFDEHGHNYLVMEFVEGRTLSEVLEQEGRLPEARVRNWAVQVCNVLYYLHSQNPPVIFRDLKPSNIMVTNDEKIKLIDFGIARFSESGGRQATVIMTLGYAPPEQLEGKPQVKSDIYALGATLHRLLTRHDATKNSPSIFDFPTIRSLRPEITPAFDAIIGRALQKNLDARWASAAEMEQAILRLPPPPAGAGPAVPIPGGFSSGVNPVLPPGTVAGAPGTGPAANYINMARAQLNQKRFMDAFNIAQQALQLDPNNAQVYKLLGMIHARSMPPDTTRAMAAYTSALQIAPNDAETHRLVGDVYLILQRRPIEAIPAYQNAVRHDPNDGEAHRLLGQCYEQTNQPELALAEYRAALRTLPRTLLLSVQMSIGQLSLRLNRLQDAERAFVEALRLDAGNVPARHLLAQTYEREGRLPEALRECQAAVNLNRNDFSAQQTLQRLQAKLATGNMGGPGGPIR
jgi:tetratricopeptide (TPR) repeat protein/tRNA A-37 threonylcarbamoyl transferase component Bud32